MHNNIRYRLASVDCCTRRSIPEDRQLAGTKLTTITCKRCVLTNVHMCTMGCYARPLQLCGSAGARGRAGWRRSCGQSRTAERTLLRGRWTSSSKAHVLWSSPLGVRRPAVACVRYHGPKAMRPMSLRVWCVHAQPRVTQSCAPTMGAPLQAEADERPGIPRTVCGNHH
jgi:hypothetical protein